MWIPELNPTYPTTAIFKKIAHRQPTLRQIIRHPVTFLRTLDRQTVIMALLFVAALIVSPALIPFGYVKKA